MGTMSWCRGGLRRCGFLGTLVLCLSGTVALRAAAGPQGHEPSAAETRPKEPPLRVSESVEVVVADLKSYIPTRMEEEDIPGLSIALIRDGKVVWTEGFGVANRITRRPVDAQSLFEVASISKVVTTYAALRLVEQGKLSLDEPSIRYLGKRWLPPSEDGDKITLRQLASHSSGLSDNLLPVVDKRLVSSPGSTFLYSGIGMMYMQEAIEQVTGGSLEEAARGLVFEPLGMSASSFWNRPDLLSRNANGHMACIPPVLVFLLAFTVNLFVIGLVNVVLLRILKGRWKPTTRMALGVCLGAGLLALATISVLLGRPLPNFVLLIGLCSIGFVALCAVLFLVGRKILAHLPAPFRQGKAWWAAMAVWTVLSTFALLALSGRLTVPVPKGLPYPASAVGSLRTSAGDLALLLIELSEPRFLSADTAAQIRTPQISAGDGFSWGLGIGIQHSDQGNSLWQNGQTFGFRSLMVIYPEHRIGVVVLTNSDHGLSAAHDMAQRALGGKARWKYF
ncbi:MAG: beta-lactamase [Acidobacteria bacterium]|nr:beta-lactamase [Acidobacteriota bacterium]